MAILSNPFIHVVEAMNGTPTRPVGLTTALTQRYKAREAALYITMHQVMAQVGTLLTPGERVVNLMPMTNEANSGVATDGLMGMYAPKNAAAKQYAAAQDSLRGNRLWVFTTQRLLFFTVIEFLDDPGAYQAYPYARIRRMKLAERHISIPGNAHFWQRTRVSWYAVDFQTEDGNIFTETLTPANAALLKRNLLQLPAMADIELTDGVTRNNRWDAVMSNSALHGKLLMGFFWVVAIPFLLWLTWMAIMAGMGRA
ncbi:hypothetical protein [Lacticaseibacillus absianus]|uniref:hypothetical protein n=1 Tax=Lacticaseibacillus absianus TaxID=2729623 RepID=UPI0015CD8169|nr:hypothetical protein [Lacticaseibacillus absianus]